MTTRTTTNQALDELYASPLDTFVERRRALALGLRQAGDAAGAKQLGAMAKPSLSAWAVNQLWWSHRAPFEALFAAAKSLRTSPQARPAFEAQMRAIRDRARDLIVTAGHPAGAVLLRRVTTSLLALAAVGSFAPDHAGRLVVDREPPGFDAMEGVSWPAREKDSAEDDEAPAQADKAEKTEKKIPRARPVVATVDLEKRRREEENRRALAALKRELEGLENDAARHTGAAEHAQRELAAVALKRAKLEDEQRDWENAKKVAEQDAARVRKRIAEVAKSLEARPPSTQDETPM